MDIEAPLVRKTGAVSDNHELMVRALNAHGGVDLVDQPRSELRDKRKDGVEPFLKMLLGKHEPVQCTRIADRLFIPRHDLGRGFACDLACLEFDSPRASLTR